MNYLVIEHLSGSKAKQVEEFPATLYPELLIGRDLAANVRFTDAETLVGRQHVKITQAGKDSSEFRLTDLNSRNGTFINGVKIAGTSILRSGDIIQLGPDGPQLRFEARPSTEPLAADSAQTGAVPSPTLGGGRPANSPLAHLPPPTPATLPAPELVRAAAPIPPASQPPSAQPAARPVAKSRTPLILGGIAVVVVGAIMLAAGYFGYRKFFSAESEGAAPSAAHHAKGSPSAATATLGSGEAAGDAEKESDRTVWKVEVAPYRTLGGGRPGKGAADIDKPDGVAFSPKGLLYATDAGNHRVQVWDVKTGDRLGEFGHGIFGGEIVDIAVGPDETVYITDQALNLAYVFVPPQPGQQDEKGRPLSPYDYQFKGTRFGEQQFEKLGGIAVDSRGRIYGVDAHRNDVHRFSADGRVDPTFKFEKKRADGTTYLHGCEGIAIDEGTGSLFIASEKDSTIAVFDLESGAYRHQYVGASLDPGDKPGGKHVFFGSVEGLTIAQGHLLAVDESAGHIQMFDLKKADSYNHDLPSYTPAVNRPSGYRGYIGHGPLVNFEDKTNLELQKQVKAGSIIPGQANPAGNFCSPDSITSYTDAASNESYIAIADQCNYRLVIYRWSDISKALGQPIVVAEVKSTPPPEPSPSASVVVKANPKPVAKPKPPPPKAPAKQPVAKAKPAPAPPPASDKKKSEAPSDAGKEKEKKKKKKKQA
jgi:pSer/pThr/pTyr-binding forkhead associated (FHA) protein